MNDIPAKMASSTARPIVHLLIQRRVRRGANDFDSRSIESFERSGESTQESIRHERRDERRETRDKRQETRDESPVARREPLISRLLSLASSRYSNSLSVSSYNGWLLSANESTMLKWSRPGSM